jgi:hypothetical protein
MDDYPRRYPPLERTAMPIGRRTREKDERVERVKQGPALAPGPWEAKRSSAATAPACKVARLLLQSMRLTEFPAACCVMDDFRCPDCGSPALVYPEVLERDAPVTCAKCGALN